MSFYIFTLFRIWWFKYYTTAKFQNVDDIFTQCCFLKVLNSYNHRSIFFSLTVHRVFFCSSTSTRILSDYIYTNASRKNQTKFQPCLCHDRIFFIMVVESRPQCRFTWLNTLFQLLIWCKDTIIDVSRTNSWHVCEGFSSDDWCIIISNTHSLP